MAIFLSPFIVNAQTADFSFSLSGHCNDGTATFTDLSGPGQVNHWVWSFGNSNSLDTTDPAKGKNPSARYPGPGVYTVSLAVNGGTPVTKKNTIYPNPEPDFSSSTTTGCEPMSVTLTATANNDVVPYKIGNTPVGGVNAGAITSYRWDFQGKIPSITESDPVLSLNNLAANDYDVTLTVTTNSGCTATLTKPKFVSVVSPNNLKDLAINIEEPGEVNGKFCSSDNVTLAGFFVSIITKINRYENS